MFTVPIFDSNGVVKSEIEIDDDLVYVNGRVHKGKKHYYKGAGIPYKSHFVHKENITDQYDTIDYTGIFYVGTNVSKQCFKSKFGIFQEKYQPFFPDFIGTCSGKEGTIVLNSETFKLSSVVVHDVVQYDKENDQSYYIVDFKCHRNRYLDSNGSPEKLYQLLRYMIENNWNFLWDKNTIGDITPLGEVSDVADLFVSDTLIHKFGTIYSLLYSMGRASKQKYMEFVGFCGLVHLNEKYFVYNTIQLLKKFGVNTKDITPFGSDISNYQHAILNYLIVGKNCAYCSCDLYMSSGNAVRDQYISDTKKLFNV